MRNNNQAIIRKITKRSLASNQKRNFFIITAIALTTLLLASAFSIGISFIESQKMEQIRLMGTTAHAAILHPSAEEWERLKNLDYIKSAGVGIDVADVNHTPQMGDMVLSLYYYDQIQWEEMRSPAFTGVVGGYPQGENEVMIPYWVLERLGIAPEIGMEIPLSYTVQKGGEYTRYDGVFTLSGWFKSYTHIRSGNIDVLLVSEELPRKYGKSAESDGAAFVIFTDGANINGYCERLERDLHITGSWRVRPVPIYDASGDTSVFPALLLISAFFVFTGYLLIYNVLSISIARDVRFYGLLKTVGTTSRQIRRIVTGQILWMCATGIPLGAAFAALLSLAIIPALLSVMSTAPTGAVVSFSPIIYIGSAVFSLLTAFLGAAKPAMKAAAVSPVEAQKYTGVETINNKVHVPTRGKPYRMALRNMFRDRKRAVIVLLSLFLGLTTFITVTTIVASMDPDNYVNSYVGNDFILTNNTSDVGYGVPKQKFNDAFLSAVSGIPGLGSMRYDTKGWFFTTYTEYWDAYLNAYVKRNPDFVRSDAELEMVKKIFGGIAVGVDGGALAELGGDYDIEAFERGEFVLFAAKGVSFIDTAALEGIETVELRIEQEGGVLTEIPVGGIVSYFFHNNESGIVPTIIMSNALMERLTGEAIRSKLYIDTADGFDAAFLGALKNLTDGDYEISRVSKIEAREQMRDAKMILYILGGGIAFVLGLIGILNFINVMSVGVIVRKREFAALRSVGMSRGQVRAMLMCEGAGYAAFTLLFAVLPGNALTYGIFKMFQQEAAYAVFTYPVMPVLITIALILIVCAAAPEMMYRSVNQSSITEQLREAE